MKRNRVNCCVGCFNDAEIIGIIKSQKQTGKCDFCGQAGKNIYPLNEDSTLSDVFGELLDIYTLASSLPVSFPKENINLLKNLLYSKWSIFNIEPDCIYRLITKICHEKYAEQPELFDGPIAILEAEDKVYLQSNSLIGNYQWSDFVKAITSENRFHTDHINKKVLDLFTRCVKKVYKAGTEFYRARICVDVSGYSKSEMGAPPAHLAATGRINPLGISILYLADTEKTTLHEIRAGAFDYVTVGRFHLQKDIEVINFTSLDRISPFIANSMGIDYTQHAINIEHLKLISKEIAKPLRRHDSQLDYLPTQYVSDYIKSQGFDGVEYASTMYAEGFNLAVFDETLFKCVDTTSI